MILRSRSVLDEDRWSTRFGKSLTPCDGVAGGVMSTTLVCIRQLDFHCCQITEQMHASLCHHHRHAPDELDRDLCHGCAVRLEESHVLGNRYRPSHLKSHKQHVSWVLRNLLHVSDDLASWRKLWSV